MKGCSPCCVLFIPPKHGECAVPQNLGLHHNIDFSTLGRPTSTHEGTLAQRLTRVTPNLECLKSCS